MSDLRQYIVEEWAEEYRGGRLPRREFLRRMALMMGGSAVAVVALEELGFAFPATDVAQAASTEGTLQAQADGVTVPPGDAAIESAGMITYPSDVATVQAYLARPKAGAPVPGIIVIHENRGLLEHFPDVCRRLAKAGYAALAPDLVSPVGGTARFSDPAQATAALGQTPPERLVAMLVAGVKHLQGLTGVRRDRLGAMGFCFGGGMTWRLATASPDLRAVIPFYGPNPPLEDVAKIKAAVLAIYGELDTRINAGIPAVRDAMRKAGVTHEIVIYPGAGHAFFNDTGAQYHAASATDAWRRVLGWFEKWLKG